MKRCLQVENVSAGYGSGNVLTDLSLNLDVSEIVTLLGRNGAGKSTLLNALMGLIPVAAGRILFMGEEISKLRSAARVKLGIGFLRQNESVLPSQSILDNLIVSCHLYERRAAKKRVDELLRHFPELIPRKKEKVRNLSGGERQRVALLAALANQPKLLLLDEPFAPLDQLARQKVSDDIQRLNSKLKMAILIVEQDGKTALEISNRAILLERGEIAFNGNSNWKLIEPILRNVAQRLEP